MIELQAVRRIVLLLILALSFFVYTLVRGRQADAQVNTAPRFPSEVTPYKFADLPHGRIYKTVHDGCELYIVESEWQTGTGLNHTYNITLGRCK